MAQWEHVYCGSVYEQRVPPPDCEFCRSLLIKVGWRDLGWRAVNMGASREVVRPKVGSIGKTQRQRIYKRDGYRCVSCGCANRLELSIDHKVPRSRGGTNKDKNLQTMCKDCNVAKGNKMPVDDFSVRRVAR